MGASGGNTTIKSNTVHGYQYPQNLTHQLHKSPKMRDGYQKGAKPFLNWLNILVNDFVDIPIARQSAGAGDLVGGDGYDNRAVLAEIQSLPYVSLIRHTGHAL